MNLWEEIGPMKDKRGTIWPNAQLLMTPTACTDSPRQPTKETPHPWGKLRDTKSSSKIKITMDEK